MKKYALHLDPDFRPYLDLPRINHEIFTFPSGCEPHIKIDPDTIIEPNSTIIITQRIKTLNDLFLIALAVDALRYMGVETIELFLPYLTFARQDRRMDIGEPLSLKVMAKFINGMNLHKVYFYDVHSEISTALIDNSYVIDNHKFVAKCLEDKTGVTLVCPDVGAHKKIHKLCQALDYTGDVIMCDKIRDTTTGRILSITANYSGVPNQNLFIVDDICDGGGTFIGIAETLLQKWPWAKINLIVSHGIFSRGFPLKGIDHIYTTNSIPNTIPNTGYVTQIKLENLL